MVGYYLDYLQKTAKCCHLEAGRHQFSIYSRFHHPIAVSLCPENAITQTAYDDLHSMLSFYAAPGCYRPAQGATTTTHCPKHSDCF